VTALGFLRTSDATATLRRASIENLSTIVELLTGDRLGAARDGADGVAGLEPYNRAFEAIDVDPAHLLLVAEADGQIVATMQLSFLPGLARRGALRAQIQAVRVHADLRGSGLGRAMITWAVDQAQRRGCSLVQLTSDKQRPEAHPFYSRLGFVASHEGFTLVL
jgi:GNAT superfamily N-acetyltransferase